MMYKSQNTAAPCFLFQSHLHSIFFRGVVEIRRLGREKGNLTVSLLLTNGSLWTWANKWVEGKRGVWSVQIEGVGSSTYHCCWIHPLLAPPCPKFLPLPHLAYLPPTLTAVLPCLAGAVGSGGAVTALHSQTVSVVNDYFKTMAKGWEKIPLSASCVIIEVWIMSRLGCFFPS